MVIKPLFVLIMCLLFLMPVQDLFGQKSKKEKAAAQALVLLRFQHDANNIIKKLNKAECPLCGYVAMTKCYKNRIAT